MVESHSSGLDFSVLVFGKNESGCRERNEKYRKTYFYIDFITAHWQHDRNVLADTLEITMPIWDVLVGDSRCDIEHEDPALALGIVSIR